MSSMKGRGFDGWVEEEFEKLSRVVAEARGSTDPAWATAALEHAANLREAGQIMKWELLGFVASCLCSLLEAIAVGAPYQDSYVSIHLNALNLAKHPRYRGMRRDQAPELTSALTALSQRLGLA
jgi:hypothetical protein